MDAKVLESYSKALHDMARRLSPTDGPDLAQVALMRAWEHRESFRPGADPGPWLRTILVRVFLSHCRSSRLRREAYDRLGSEVRTVPVDGPFGHHPFPDAAAEVGLIELRERVELALVRVSPEHEDVLRRVDLAGDSYKQAADDLGVPIGTVMSRLHRARRAAAAELRAVNDEMQ
jgi:RNA polymerase sigma-70 factor (ECF subfamily)